MAHFLKNKCIKLQLKDCMMLDRGLSKSIGDLIIVTRVGMGINTRV